MKKRKQYLIVGMVILGFVCIAMSIAFCYPLFVAREEDNKRNVREENVKEAAEQREYLSITYTISDSSVKSGRMMEFYTYDLNDKKLMKHAQIPFTTQYALGAVSLADHKIYYTQGVGEDEMSVDHLFEYDMTTQKSVMLEDENRAYNDIIPVNGKLLVTAIPVHAIGTGLFDPKTKKFSYLYQQEKTDEGYRDFLYTTAPAPLNYNNRYDRFVNICSLEKDDYDDKVRAGEKPLEYRIALVDADLNKHAEYKYSLKNVLDYRITAVAQNSQDTVLMLVEKDLSGDESSELEVENQFYLINFKAKSCKRVDNPFPQMQYIHNFITVDDGKSYYISGFNAEGESGLYWYDCVNDAIEPILLDDRENDKDYHIVNFNLRME